MADKRPLPRITPGLLRRWRACYSSDHVAYVFAGRKFLSPFDILDLVTVPAGDRLWVLLRPAIIPADTLYELAGVFALSMLPSASSTDAADRAWRREGLYMLRRRQLWRRGQLSRQEWTAHRAEWTRKLCTGTRRQRYFRDAFDNACWENSWRAALNTAAVVRLFNSRDSANFERVSQEQLDIVRRVLVRLYGKPSVKKRKRARV